MRRNKGCSIKANNIAKFLFIPLLFCILGIALGMVAAGPVVEPYFKLFQITFLKEAPTFKNGTANIYLDGSSQTPASQSILKSAADIPLQGQQVGNLTIGDAKIDTPVFWGDDTHSLAKGAGIYIGSALPGQGKTILIGGHIDTVFASLKQVKSGDKIKIQTNYGDYEYQVTGHKSAADTDKTAYDLLKTNENLVLYTCGRENDFVGLTSQRYFVYAKYLSGGSLKDQG